jgi:hypothetical protein
MPVAAIHNFSANAERKRADQNERQSKDMHVDMLGE